MYFLNEEEEQRKTKEYLENIPSNVKDNFLNILSTIYYQNQVIDSLREQNKELKSEKYKDNELIAMEEECNRLRELNKRGFPISEEEDKALNKWIKNHEKEHKGGHGCVGGKYTYIFTPTSIGTFGTIKCSCGESFDFQKCC